MPAQSTALNAAIASARISSLSVAGQIGGDDVARGAVEIFRLVVVELARRDDLAGHRRLGLVVAEHGDLDLARLRHRGLDDDLAIELARRG